MASVEEAIWARRSIRAFVRDKPVPREVIEAILASASRAPNGSNIQPWKVYVLTGTARDDLAREIHAAHMRDETELRDFLYYGVPLPEPYLERRRATGWGLYGHLGLGKGNRAETKAQQGRNYVFFDAPVGMFLTMDRAMGQGAWLDMAAFLQTLLLAAQGHGLATCPQAAFCNFPHTIRRLLALDDDEVIVTGLALGYADPDAAVNGYQPPRLAVDEFATFLDRLPRQMQQPARRLPAAE